MKNRSDSDSRIRVWLGQAFMLQVAEPHLNGPGGDAPIIIHSAASGTQHVICGQGTAPAKATIAAFQELGLDLIPGTGFLPAVVPGAFGAWCRVLRDWGTWELPDMLAYAIGYARQGVPLIVIQRQLGHSNLGITSVYLQGIDSAEIIDTVHAAAPR